MDNTIQEQIAAFVESLESAEDQAEREGYVPAEELRRRCHDAKAEGRADRIALQSLQSALRPLSANAVDE